MVQKKFPRILIVVCDKIIPIAKNLEAICQFPKSDIFLLGDATGECEAWNTLIISTEIQYSPLTIISH